MSSANLLHANLALLWHADIPQLAHYLDPTDISDDEETAAPGTSGGVMGPRQQWREAIATWPAMDIFESVFCSDVSSNFSNSTDEEEE